MENMAEFEKAMPSIGPEFIANRIAKLRQIAADKAKKGDKYFLARQHAMFMQGRLECKCRDRDCSGCRVLLTIACALETDLETLDPARCEHEEAIAIGIMGRRKAEVRDLMLRVSRYTRHEPDLRQRSLNQDTKTESGS